MGWRWHRRWGFNGDGEFHGRRLVCRCLPFGKNSGLRFLREKKGSGSLTYKPNIMEYHEYHGVSSVCDFFILFSKWQRLRSFFIFHGFPTGSSPLDPGMTARSARPAAISQMGHLVSSGWERPPRQEGGAEGSPGSSCRNPAESSQKLPDFEPLETKHGPSPPMEWCLTYLDIRC